MHLSSPRSGRHRRRRPPRRGGGMRRRFAARRSLPHLLLCAAAAAAVWNCGGSGIFRAAVADDAAAAAAAVDYDWDLVSTVGYPLIASSDGEGSDINVRFRYEYAGELEDGSKFLTAALYQDDCSTEANDGALVPTETLDTDHRAYTVDVGIAKEKIVPSVLFREADGSETTADIAFCLVVDYNFVSKETGQTKSINFHKTTVGITVDLLDDFRITGVTVVSTDTGGTAAGTAGAEIRFPVAAYFCDDRNVETDVGGYRSGDALQVCVRIDEASLPPELQDAAGTGALRVDDILRFIVSQPGGPGAAMINIEDSQADELTTKLCNELSDGICNIKTQLSTGFFRDAVPHDLRIDGVAVIVADEGVAAADVAERRRYVRALAGDIRGGDAGARSTRRGGNSRKLQDEGAAADGPEAEGSGETQREHSPFSLNAPLAKDVSGTTTTTTTTNTTTIVTEKHFYDENWMTYIIIGIVVSVVLSCICCCLCNLHLLCPAKRKKKFVKEQIIIRPPPQSYIPGTAAMTLNQIRINVNPNAPNPAKGPAVVGRGTGPATTAPTARCDVRSQAYSAGNSSGYAPSHIRTPSSGSQFGGNTQQLHASNNTIGQTTIPTRADLSSRRSNVNSAGPSMMSSVTGPTRNPGRYGPGQGQPIGVHQQCGSGTMGTAVDRNALTNRTPPHSQRTWMQSVESNGGGNRNSGEAAAPRGGDRPEANNPDDDISLGQPTISTKHGSFGPSKSHAYDRNAPEAFEDEFSPRAGDILTIQDRAEPSSSSARGRIPQDGDGLLRRPGARGIDAPNGRADESRRSGDGTVYPPTLARAGGGRREGLLLKQASERQVRGSPSKRQLCDKDAPEAFQDGFFPGAARDILTTQDRTRQSNSSARERYPQDRAGLLRPDTKRIDAMNRQASESWRARDGTVYPPTLARSGGSRREGLLKQASDPQMCSRVFDPRHSSLPGSRRSFNPEGRPPNSQTRSSYNDQRNVRERDARSGDNGREGLLKQVSDRQMRSSPSQNGGEQNELNVSLRSSGQRYRADPKESAGQNRRGLRKEASDGRIGYRPGASVPLGFSAP